MHVLIIHPDGMLRRILATYLERAHYQVTAVSTVVEGLLHVQTMPGNQVLLAWPQPNRTGLIFLHHLRADHTQAYTPVILLSSATTGNVLQIGLDAGADDYFVRPFTPAQVYERLRVGERIAALETQLARFQAQHDHHRHTDPLTELLTRAAFAVQAEARPTRTVAPGVNTSLVLLDVPQLPAINHAYGHYTGDAVLKHVVGLIRQTVRQHDLLGRWTGTRIVILLQDVAAPETTAIVARLAQHLVARPFLGPDGRPLDLVVRSGSVAIARDTPTSLDTLVAQAALALHPLSVTVNRQ